MRLSYRVISPGVLDKRTSKNPWSKLDIAQAGRVYYWHASWSVEAHAYLDDNLSVDTGRISICPEH